LYQGRLKDILLLYKYRQFKVLGKGLADFISRSLGRDEALFLGVDYLLPVPLHPRKKRKRGFNQAREIALWLGKKHTIPCLDKVLVKKKNTPPQTTLESKERLQNVKDAYAVNKPALIAGKTVLLIDDVFTTGATINECSRVLKKAGIREVRALTLAQPAF
jgi:ComF family protein